MSRLPCRTVYSRSVHVVIMGCGRVGARLASVLDDQGHSVAVIDQDSGAFSRLPPIFAGITIKGIGFDRDTLLRSGIESASAFAAVSSGDNSNVIAARVAKETFDVEHVVARIYDPRRAEIYERLGIPTVATVGWTSEEILHRMFPEHTHQEWRDPTGTLALGEFIVSPQWIGMRYRDVANRLRVTIATVTRFGESVRMHPDLVIQQNDQLRVIYEIRREEEIAHALSEPPEDLG